MSKINARTAVPKAVIDLSGYATKTEMSSTYATKTEMADNLANDATVKQFVQDLAAAETAEYAVIRGEFESLQKDVKDINDDLAVVEANFASLESEGYMSPN